MDQAHPLVGRPQQLPILSQTTQALPHGRYVRLLQIVHEPRKAHGFWITLQVFDLDNAPMFWALSYTWGPPEVSQDTFEPALDGDAEVVVDCDHRPVSLGQNLFDFLRRAHKDGLFLSPKSPVPVRTREPFLHLRAPSGVQARLGPQDFGREAFLWVDAICIDQSNILERSHQVALMGDIYRRAEKVIVWLSPKEPDDDMMWVFEDLGPRLCQLWDTKGTELFDRKHLDFKDPDLVRRIGEESCSRWRRTWPRFFDYFAKMRWFRRGWVVQEVLLNSSRNVAIMCGQRTIEWKGFEDLMRLFIGRLKAGSIIQNRLSKMLSNTLSVNELLSISRIRDGIKTVKKLRRTSGQDSRDVQHAAWKKIYDLVWELRKAQFSDAKDHIYGCLGLATEILGQSEWTEFAPDYTLSDEEVLVNFTKLVMERQPWLDVVLAHAEYHDAVSGRNLPSWVPDYRVKSGSYHIEGSSLGRTRDFDASLSHSDESFRMEVGTNRALTVEGFRLGVISEIGSVMGRNPITLPEWLIDYCLLPGRYSATGELRPLTVARTLTGLRDGPAFAKIDSSTTRDYFLIIFAWAIKTRVESADERELLVRKFDLVDDSEIAESLPSSEALKTACASSASQLIAHLENNVLDSLTRDALHGRQLFLTSQGYLVYAPTWTQMGDEVWVIKGSRIPLILRKVGDGGQNNVVGGCYAHGFMYGEAVTQETNQHISRIELV